MAHNEDHEFDIEDQERATRSIFSRVLLVALSMLVIMGLLYISGIRQYFFYQRTPSSIEQTLIETRVNATTLILPLTIFIVRGNQQYGSTRTEDNARRLVQNSSRIWEQADVSLSVKNVFTISKSDEEMKIFFDTPSVFIQNINAFDPTTINVFLVGNLGGINGIALVGLNSVAVADYTTVYDFRALAHELGHIVGLRHVAESREWLMYQGANGSMLSLEEIERARLGTREFEEF